MSEEEILSYVAEVIPGYVSHIRPAGEFHIDACIEKQTEALKELFRESRGLGRYDVLSQQDIREFDLTASHFERGMRARALAAQETYNKERMLWSIRGTSAKSAILQAFQKAGLDAEVELQRFRAKVTVDLGGRTLHFYITYKALEKPDTLPNMVQAVLDLKDAACRLGSLN